MTELQPIIVFHGRHFVRHLGICNPICVKFLLVMSGVIMSNLKKNGVSIQIGLKYGPDTARPLNAILIKNNDSSVVSAQQNMTQVLIEQICIIDNDKSSELITFNSI